MPAPGNSRSPNANRTRSAAAAVAILIATLHGCGGDAATDPATGTSEATGSLAPPAASRPAPNPPDRKHPVVRIETTQGSITLTLDAVNAPGTVHNFLNNVSDGFYDGTTFHFVDADTMILGGGYGIDQQLKPARATIRNEAHNGLKNVRGSVAMARDHAIIDSATTQFFINLQDAPQRDHRGDEPGDYGYCVFGKVTEGLEIAERISRSPTQNNGGDMIQTPQPPVVIQSIRLAM